MDKLKQLELKIANEAPYVGAKPYSHNIIGMVLQQVEEEFGIEKVKLFVKIYDLDKKGWGFILNK